MLCIGLFAIKFLQRIGLGVFLSVFFLLSCKESEPLNEWRLHSPDSSLHLTVFITSDSLGSQLGYKVATLNGKVLTDVIKTSILGFKAKDGDLSGGFTLEEVGEITEVKETFSVLTGKASRIKNLANQKTWLFRTADGTKLEVTFRAYDDGFAFKYKYPETNAKTFTIEEELSSFNFASTGEAWLQPYDTISKWTPAYEKYFLAEVPIGASSPNTEGWCFPGLFKSGDNWILLSEAGAMNGFYGAHLQAEKDGGYRIRLPEKEEAMGQGSTAPLNNSGWESPWRFAIIGENLSTIVASKMVKRLAEPSVIKNTSWIKPGRASWSWWSDHDSSRSYEKMIPFIDLAQEMGWEYFLVDANWETMPDGDLKDIVEYGKERGVGILVWYNSGGPHNTVTEGPRDRMHLAESRRAEFKKLRDLGVKGVKIDFFQSDKPHIIQQYEDILKDAANNEILVNFHGATIPRGWSRTYPNLMTMESVRGAETYSFSKEYPDYAPSQNTILPFTRNLLGSMDYTPVTFSDQTYPHSTTYSHELALAVLFESGIQHFADRVESYRSLEPKVKEFLQEVPVAWDNTVLIDGYPGSHVSLARRKGALWYVAGINGADKEKEMTIPFHFLKSGLYEVRLIEDGESDETFAIKSVEVQKDSKIKIKVPPFGGFSMKLAKSK